MSVCLVVVNTVPPTFSRIQSELEDEEEGVPAAEVEADVDDEDDDDDVGKCEGGGAAEAEVGGDEDILLVGRVVSQVLTNLTSQVAKKAKTVE